MKQGRFININFWVFIAILLIICLFSFPKVVKSWYNEELNATWLAQFEESKVPVDVTPDPKPLPNEDEPSTEVTWIWTDFQGNQNKIITKVKNTYLESAKKNRTHSGVNNLDELYGVLFRHDKTLLQGFIGQLKNKMSQRNMGYIESIEYVCSAVQSINYTLVLGEGGYEDANGRIVKCPCEITFTPGAPPERFIDRCDSKIENGCCNDVVGGLFSPFEFFYSKTGDCDTRAVFAYTVLKDLGFDVAVMVSNDQG
ncbi:MAG: hypothetical protein EBV19_08535, partial [Flavobacteriia bacterium]|nr:hypothetical protein [Flavobacteriia bacterium]